MSEGTARQGGGPGAGRARTRAHHRSIATRRRRRCRIIRDRLAKMNVRVPLIGDFHYIGHKLLADHRPAPGARTSTASIPAMSVQGQEGPAIRRHHRDRAIRHCKPVRIGANWGSLIRKLLTHTDDEMRIGAAAEARAVMREAMVQTAPALRRSRGRDGLPKKPASTCRAKVSAVQDLDRGLSRSGAPLELCDPSGPHRSRMGSKGIVASSPPRHSAAACGIGDTIPSRSQPEPGGDRTLEVTVGQEILQTMGFRVFVRWSRPSRLRAHHPRPRFQELARDIQSFIPHLDAGMEERAIRAWKRSMSR